MSIPSLRRRADAPHGPSLIPAWCFRMLEVQVGQEWSLSRPRAAAVGRLRLAPFARVASGGTPARVRVCVADAPSQKYLRLGARSALGCAPFPLYPAAARPAWVPSGASRCAGDVIGSGRSSPGRRHLVRGSGAHRWPLPVAGLGGLIQTAVGAAGGVGGLRTNRSGWMEYALVRTVCRASMIAAERL